MADFKVLVVEDSAQMRDFVVNYILQPNNFEPIVARDGVEGLELARTRRPDLMLLDYEMPRMNGLDLLRTLRMQNNHVPTILMTSHGSEEVAVEVFRLGVRDYLTKPFTVQEALAAVRAALRVTQLEREREQLTQSLKSSNVTLQQRLREFDTLYQVGKSVTALLDPQALMERIVDAAIYIMQAEEAALVLTDPATGQSTRHVRKARPGGSGQRSGRRDVVQLAHDAIETQNEAITGAGSMLSIPLQVGPRPLGALSIGNKLASRTFTVHDKQLLRMLADYAAIGIENARLLQEVEDTKEREKRQIRRLFEHYVAPSVVEQIISAPESVAPGGVCQVVSVVFADLRGFSDFSAHSTPEGLVRVLNRYLAVAAQAILDHGGTLDKFMGDAVMGFFNAPLAQPDHPLRAVQAAWAMRANVEQLRGTLPLLERLQFGIGISVGEVVVGNIGTPQQMNYTVIGDAVNRGKQLQEHARGGQILLCQPTYHLIKHLAEVRPSDPVNLKGHRQPQPVYELLGFKPGAVPSG